MDESEHLDLKRVYELRFPKAAGAGPAAGPLRGLGLSSGFDPPDLDHDRPGRLPHHDQQGLKTPGTADYARPGLRVGQASSKWYVWLVGEEL